MTPEFPSNSPTKYIINRYPLSNSNLKAWNTADEFMLWYVTQNDLAHQTKLIINDTFGYLTTHLISADTNIVFNLKSQFDAIQHNLNQHQITFEQNQFIPPLNSNKKTIDLALIKVPKSLELFDLYLQQIHQSITLNAKVICGFMTKYFSPQQLKIASKYFNTIEQTKAWKKSRLMVLSHPKNIQNQSQVQAFTTEFGTIKQYKGVFSSGHIDYATQFLIQNLSISQQAESILDLASGNGILAKVIHQKHPKSNIHLVDDSFLAIESSKLNVTGECFHFHHTYNLNTFKPNTFDYIISNPPFHFGHEIDLTLPASLFTEAQRVLKPTGTFEFVANRHLNYYPILKKLFDTIEVKAQNSKFMVYQCW